MAVRKIIRMGHPTLRKVARGRSKRANSASPEIGRLVNDMIDTLNDSGGIGLAAPQIDESVRLAIIEIDGGPSRYGEIPAMPLTVFVNPTHRSRRPEGGRLLGRLSVGAGTARLRRAAAVRARRRIRICDGKKHVLELKGFLATVFQHEFDHLDGKLYIDRMTDPTKLVFEEEYLRYLSADE